MAAKGDAGRWVWRLTLASSFAVSGAGFAQDAQPDQEIRRKSQQILAEPEFRYFEHLGDSPDRPETRGGRNRPSFGSSSGSGSGGSGQGSGSNGSSRGSSSQTRSQKGKNRDNSSSSDTNNSPGSSSSADSLGAGLGAIGNVAGFLFHGLAYLLLIAVCGLILYLVVQAVINREPAPQALDAPFAGFNLPQDEEHPPGELPADAYLAKAHELAGQRRYREAIGQLLWGGMSSIERAELIRHRRGLTLRDYLRSLRGKKPHYDGFKAMIRLYEPIGFGRRVASYQTFQDALSGYQQAVDGLA